MNDEAAPSASEQVRTFSFYKGSEESPSPKTDGTFDWHASIATVREQLAEVMGSRSVSFLLGAGCSSSIKIGKQLGIDTMYPLAREFAKTIGKRGDKLFANATERRILKDTLGLDIAQKEFAENLERLMEALFSYQFVLSRSVLDRHRRPAQCVRSMIDKLQRFLVHRCTVGAFTQGDNSVTALYEQFYRKLVFRDRSLPRPWVFTVNYDLFNELAMDRLGVPYCNGFSGTVERRFNPAVFRYALAEQLDLTNRKWSVVDGFVYLCKLHGSVTWNEDNHGLFPIRENQIPDALDRVMIYPTPAKQAASLGSPYSDLFREFHSQIVREQSILFTIGYGFGDEHVNKIIYQALTIPTFRLIALMPPDAMGEFSKLKALGDPRIWIIGESSASGSELLAHHFEFFVQQLMPDPPGDRIDKAVSQVIERLVAPSRRDTISERSSGSGR